MDMFSRLTSLFQALETREPSLDLLESFVDHWKGITNYYIQTTDETRPVKQTDIPWRLKQMLDILVYEEREQGVEETGPCLEYLLQHKILETLSTLGKAQYPPGMIQQVLLFVGRLLVQIQKPLLHLINIYRPVQLIGLCALPDSQTEKEEAQFLLVVCSRVKQDPYALNYILEIPAKTLGPTSDQSHQRNEPSNHKTETEVPSSQSESSTYNPDQSDCSISSSSPPPANSGLLYALVQLTQSQRSRVCLKAYEGLLLLVSLQCQGTEETLAQRTQLGALLSGRLVQLYSLMPLDTLEPVDIQSWPHTPWSDQFSQAGPDHMTSFFSWLDFLDHLMKEAPQVLAVKLAEAVHHQWLSAVLKPQLMSESGVLVSTAVLSSVVRLAQSQALLDQLVLFLLGTHTHPEIPLDSHTHPLRYQLIDNCDHISDEISMVSLRLFEELLQKPHSHILTNLVLRNLETRSYVTLPPAGLEDRHTDTTDPAEDSEDLEEDPFFSDSMYLDNKLLLPALPCTSSPGPPSCRHPHTADIVNSFLALVPQEVKSSQLLQGGGDDSYLLDAQTLCKECLSLSQSWGWPEDLPPSSSSSSDFYEGHLLKVLLDRLGCILDQSYELNLQLTSVWSRLSGFNHPVLQDYLDPYTPLTPSARNHFSVLIRVIGALMQRIQQVSDVSDRLVKVRRQLLGLEQETGGQHLTLLRGVIILEEFCKELAAIAFVKLPLDQE
ncbi:FHF complex subunit HOOK-interacting protein 2B-like isoform 2-T2 [Polymixia lowei]